MEDKDISLSKGIVWYNVKKFEKWNSAKMRDEYVYVIDILLSSGEKVQTNLTTITGLEQRKMTMWINANYSEEAINRRKLEKETRLKLKHNREFLIMTVANVLLFVYNVYTVFIMR